MKKYLVPLSFALALSAAFAWAQIGGGGLQGPTSGSGAPGGSNFSIQYKASANALGGTGPGSATQVLTSNGAGSAPTFQAPAAGGVTQTTGTFEVTWNTSDCTSPSPATQTFNYTLTGNLVVVRVVDNFSCTSGTTSFASTAAQLPVAIRPARNEFVRNVSVTDNGSLGTGCMRFDAAGIITMTFANTLATAASCSTGTASWTASGAKGITGGSGQGPALVYTLDAD
jgi:hypothetical protein